MLVEQLQPFLDVLIEVLKRLALAKLLEPRAACDLHQLVAAGELHGKLPP